MDAFDLDQTAGLFGRLGWIERGVAGDELDGMSEHAAAFVELLDRQFDAGLDRWAELGQRAGEVGQQADLERFVGDDRLRLLEVVFGIAGHRHDRAAAEVEGGHADLLDLAVGVLPDADVAGGHVAVGVPVERGGCAGVVDLVAVADRVQRSGDPVGAGRDALARRRGRGAEAVADRAGVGRAGDLGGQADGDRGVVGLADEGQRREFAVLGDVRLVEGAQRVGLGPGGGRGALHAVQVLAADRVDQVLALGAVDEEEVVEQALLQRLAQEDFGLLGEGDRDQRLRAVVGGLLQLGEVGRLTVLDRDQVGVSAPGAGEGVGQSLTVGVVEVEHADVAESLVGGELRQHRTLSGVGGGAAEEEVVVLGDGQLRRGRGGRDDRHAGLRGDGFRHGQGDR